jgi:diguanylate cyclase (GGDEF)-like protein/PAS domain S-box-containing protein
LAQRVPSLISRLLRPLDGVERRRISPRVTVVVPAVAVVLTMALAVSALVADQLRETATRSNQRSAEAIVRGYVDPLLDEESLALGAPRDLGIDGQLERLVAAGDFRRVKVWSRDGRVVYSDAPELRGRRFTIEHDLAEAFSGRTIAEFGEQGHEEEAGLPARFLEIYVPIRGAEDANPIGVYEVYLDAAPIESIVERSRQNVFLLALLASSALLGLLWIAFAATSRMLARQNVELRDRAATEQLLTADLRRSEERFRSLVRNSADIILVLQEDGTIAYESPAVERVLGRTTEERVGRSPLDLVHPDDRDLAKRLLVDLAETPGAEATAELRLRHADGSWRTIEAAAKNLLDDVAVAGIVVNYRDITDRKQLEEQLRHQAFHDSLTGLANRALFLDRLEHALARSSRRDRRMAVLYLDLDDFKAVNDSLGHPVGDRLLVAVSERLRGALRPADTAARMGGDEFAVLLDEMPAGTQRREIAERLLRTLRGPYGIDGRQLLVRVSIGMATPRTAGETADDLLRNADLAMYAAKRKGKDRVELFRSRLYAQERDRLALKTDLERALDRGELRVVYQPILELRTGAMVGAEALLRWTHPERGPIPPAEFIPLAEEGGQIVELGRFVLRTACQEVARWPRPVRGWPLAISVNLSARQLDGTLVKEVSQALAASDLEPARLTLEITESVLVQDSQGTIERLQGLKDLGVRLAIDDFGTGYSSLGYLRRFPIDALKIDRSFVAGLDGHADQSALVGSIIRLAETLRLDTVAEGIEDERQRRELVALGAHLGQGYLFSHPLEPEALVEFARTRGRPNLPSVASA